MLKIVINDHYTPAKKAAVRLAKKNNYKVLELKTDKSIRAQQDLIITARNDKDVHVIPTVQSPLLNTAKASDIYIADEMYNVRRLSDIAPSINEKHNIEKLYLGGRIK